MPLTLVLGPANSAKAGEVLGAYARAATRDALLVVPTAADVGYYERELAAPGVTLGRTLTFAGLIDEIAARANFRRARLTPLQRDRVLRRVIAASRLQSLARSATGSGFARAAGRLITEFEQGRVTPARLTTALKAWAGAAPERIAYCNDIAAIYRRYLDELDTLDRVDAETYAWSALDALRELPTNWGSTPVFFYGFDDLTPIELDAIETLARRADAAITVSLTYEPGRSALAARATVVEELRGLAQAVTQLPALDDHYEPDSRAALHHLERHLFEPDPPSLEPDAAVALMEAGGERAEAELVTAEVLAALAEGVPAQEIVVVCRSLARSGELFETALKRHGVVVDSARQIPLTHTALGRALVALTRSALLPGPQRTVGDLIAYLRHPGLVEAPDAVDQLEAEVRRNGIQTQASLNVRAPALGAAMSALDELRRAVDPAADLPDHIRRLLAAPYGEQAVVMSAVQQLDARAAGTVLEALTQLEQLSQGRNMSVPELIEMLEGLQVPAHGLPSAGAVLVAEPLAIRARRFRRVFITGLCEGEFPSPQTVSGDPFLGEERRRELALASGLVLPPPPDPLDRERYLLYASVSRATERVTFSYRSSDEDGNVVMPSPFLEDVAELFAGDWRERRRRRLLADVTWTVEEAPTERERIVATAFAEKADTDPAAHALGAAAASHWLSDQAMSHVRHRHVVSAGALETFAACPVKWLVERQLDHRGLEPDPDPLVRGSFIHAVLERVISRLGAPLRPDTLRRAESILRQAVGSEPGGTRSTPAGKDLVAEARAKVAPGQPVAVRAAVLRGIEAELRRYLRYEAADGSDWVPLRAELRFGLGTDPDQEEEALPAVELDDGEHRVLLSGVIDRVDADPHDDRRVIVRDYKSGIKRDTWPVARWLDDRQIQVALYMIAVRRLLDVHAVAGFYQPLAGDDLRPRGVYDASADVGDHAVFKDELSASELDSLLEEIENEAVAVATVLRSGELTPTPETCSAGGTCRYPGICWAER
jgi:ATP-dependent helicase/DNAse subunit B